MILTLWLRSSGWTNHSGGENSVSRQAWKRDPDAAYDDRNRREWAGAASTNENAAFVGRPPGGVGAKISQHLAVGRAQLAPENVLRTRKSRVALFREHFPRLRRTATDNRPNLRPAGGKSSSPAVGARPAARGTTQPHRTSGRKYGHGLQATFKGYNKFKNCKDNHFSS